MSRMLAVAAREVRERWLLFPAGLVLGLIPLVLPAFGVERGAVPFFGVVTAVLLSSTATVLIGSTMLARDAANGRLGFLFSRPLPWPAIWGGKWLAALALVTGTGVLTAMPLIAVYPSPSPGESWLRAFADGPGLALSLSLLVLGVGVTNFASTAYRSRSGWIALDLGLFAAALWATRQYVAALWRHGFFVPDDLVAALGLLPLCLGLLAASAAQTAVGRTDARRGHHAMSFVFWAVVGLTLAAATGYVYWVRSAGPAEMTAYAVKRDPAGRWIYVDGWTGRGGWQYACGRLVDTVTGAWVAPSESDHRWGARFSADGRFGVFPESDGGGAAVVLVDLVASPPRAVHVRLEASPPPDWYTSFAVSPSADAIFMAHQSGASIFALPSGRRVATTTIEPGWRPAATRFVGEGRARAWLLPHAGPAVVSPRAEIRVVDLAKDGTSRTRLFPTARSFDLPFREWGTVLPDSAGQRLVTFDAGAHLRDGFTGDLLATLAEPGGDLAASFLTDGRVVVGESHPSGGDNGQGGTTLRVFDHDGARLAEMHLDLPPPGVHVGPEVAPGRVLVASYRSLFLSTDTLVVDVDASRVVERLSGLRPATGFWAGTAVSAARTDEGSVQFFRDDAGRTIRVDFRDGTRTTVTGPGAPPGERIRIGW